MKTTPPLHPKNESSQDLFDLSLSRTIVPPNASASRSHGRYAVGLRPNLDPRR